MIIVSPKISGLGSGGPHPPRHAPTPTVIMSPESDKEEDPGPMAAVDHVFIVHAEPRGDCLDRIMMQLDGSDLRYTPRSQLPARDGTAEDLSAYLAEDAQTDMADFLKTKKKRFVTQVTPKAVGHFMSHLDVWQLIAALPNKQAHVLVVSDATKIPVDANTRLAPAWRHAVKAHARHHPVLVFWNGGEFVVGAVTAGLSGGAPKTTDGGGGGGSGGANATDTITTSIPTPTGSAGQKPATVPAGTIPIPIPSSENIVTASRALLDDLQSPPFVPTGPWWSTLAYSLTPHTAEVLLSSKTGLVPIALTLEGALQVLVRRHVATVYMCPRLPHSTADPAAQTLRDLVPYPTYFREEEASASVKGADGGGIVPKNGASKVVGDGSCWGPVGDANMPLTNIAAIVIPVVGILVIAAIVICIVLMTRSGNKSGNGN